MCKYMAMDIETAKILPEGIEDLDAERPLGIACIALVASDTRTPVVYGTPGRAMTTAEVNRVVAEMAEHVKSGYKFVTWNGIGFDFRTLSEESTMKTTCEFLAMYHIDMMFQFFCTTGFALGLDRVARGLGLPGKLEGVNGSMAPLMWSDGRHEEVIRYVSQDVMTTLDVAEKANGKIKWVTRAGRTKFTEVGPWVSVKKCIKMPLPDTSWMEEPWERSKFTGWIKSNL